MKNFLDGLAGMLMVSADRARNRRTLRRIQEANEQNQGIVRYAPSQIEAFLDDAAPTGDLLISGGANAIRVRAVCRAIECACQQGYSVMVLHAGNSELEQGLWGYFGGSGVCLVNRGNPVYDPFFGASNGEIARLVVDSSEKGCQVHPAGRYYLYGISDYIPGTAIPPSLWGSRMRMVRYRGYPNCSRSLAAGVRWKQSWISPCARS